MDDGVEDKPLCGGCGRHAVYMLKRDCFDTCLG